MGDVGGLMKMFEENKVFDSSQELVKKLTTGKGSFSFRDMRDQFGNIMKLGPLSQVMSMLPNMGLNLSAANEKEGTNRIKRFLTIIDSMNEKELDGDNKAFNAQPTRIRRVALGSGSSELQVAELMEAFKPLQKMGEKLGEFAKMGIDPTKMGPGLVGQKGRQAQANMGQLASMFDPKMLAKMGGPGAIQKMMQSMTQGGGMGALANMMKGMGGMGGMGMPPGMMPPGMGGPAAGGKPGGK